MGAVTAITCNDCDVELEATELETAVELNARAQDEGWAVNFRRPDYEAVHRRQFVDDMTYDYCNDCAISAREEVAEYEAELAEQEVADTEEDDEPATNGFCERCGAPIVNGEFDITRAQTPA